MFQNDEAITLSIILILDHFSRKLFLNQHQIKPQSETKPEGSGGHQLAIIRVIARQEVG